MMTSVYSPLWNAIAMKLDFKAAIANWLTFADEISIAVNTSTDSTWEALDTYVTETGLPVVLTKTEFDLMADPFAYGKIENTALQRCTGEILIQQNMDERMRVDRDILDMIGLKLIATPNVGALFVPNIDLYGSREMYLPPRAAKWYIHKPGFFRGAVNFGLKADGRPDYNKTSTDELIDRNGNLVPTVPLLEDLSIEALRAYVARGMPLVYHLGYVDFKERLDRSIWWKARWEKVTGDENAHPTTIEEIAARETKTHGLPLWEERS